MASAMVSDVATDFPRHSYNMVDVPPSSSTSNSNSNANPNPTSTSTSTLTDSSSQSHSQSQSQSSQDYPSTQPSSATPTSSSSRPIDIPQPASRPRSDQDAVPPDPFAQQRRPPKHEFDAQRAHEQRLAEQQQQQQQQHAPAGTAAAGAVDETSTTAPASARPQIATAGVQGYVHQGRRMQVASNPTTAPQSPQLLPTIRSSLSMSGNNSPARIKVRDLNHIQSFASEEILSRQNSSTRLRAGAGAGRVDEGGGGEGGGPGSGPGPAGSAAAAGGLAQKFDIASMPVQDIIEMVAGLLTKITSTNDRAHERDVKSHIPNLQNAAAAAAAGVNEPVPAQGSQTDAAGAGSATGSVNNGQSSSAQLDIRGMHRQTQSVLSFHGKNVPSISILMYLSRIHKYCPTTYEVFLSLLIYFDRMTENINKGVVHSFRNLDPMEPDDELAANTTNSRRSTTTSQTTSAGEEEGAGKVGIDSKPPIMHPFVVDSFNIHRLIMAGVTCASKFFSDVFYTNSRYAKVGGLPLHELNHLELQFLLLNDFKLYIPIDELEHYGSLLVQFYAEEIMAQQLRDRQEKEELEQKERDEHQSDTGGSGEDTADEGVHMQG